MFKVVFFGVIMSIIFGYELCTLIEIGLNGFEGDKIKDKVEYFLVLIAVIFALAFCIKTGILGII